MKLERSIGSIETGKHADIIAVKGNPPDDITILENVEFVKKGGKVYLAKDYLVRDYATESCGNIYALLLKDVSNYLQIKVGQA